MTVDDIIIKTSITLGVIVLTAAINFFIGITGNVGLMGMLTFVGAIGALVAVMISSFTRAYGSAALTLTYAAFEGLFVGGISLLLASAGVTISRNINVGSIIFQALIGTIGVFAGMLYVYKTGAIKVTNKMRRIITASLIGVLALVLVNVLMGVFLHVTPLTAGGPLSIIVTLGFIVLAAFTFLLDFDSADQMMRAGAPAKMAWGVALGLAVTLVWLYTEILRLLSYLRN